ncbi:fibronectin-like [Glandiceps talaboti]
MHLQLVNSINTPAIVPISGTLGSLTLEGLGPDKEYTVTVQVLRGVGATKGESDTRTYSLRTVAAEPAEVVIQDIESTRLGLTWGEVDGSFAGYLVQINPGPTDGSSSSVFKPKNDQRDVEFDNLVPGELYTLTITVSELSITETAQQRTIPSMPGSISTSVTETTITATWGAASDVFDSYDIVYVRATDKQVFEAGSVSSGDPRTFTITDLGPNSLFTVQVFTVSGSGDLKERSEPRITIETTSAIAGNTFLVKSYTQNSIEVLWAVSTDPSDTGYLISVDPADGGNPSTTSPDLLAKDVYNFVFDNLVPGRQYSIKLQMLGSGTVINGQQSTVPSSPGAVVQTAETPTSVTFIWVAPVGDVDEYRLSYSGEGINETEIAVIPHVDNTALSYTLGDLDPSTEYTISVTTLSMTYKSTPTTQNVMTATIPAGVILISNLTTDVIEILWGKVENASAYLVYLDGNLERVVNSDDRPHFSFTGLVAGQNYEIKIQFQMAHGSFPDSIVNQRTKPNSIEQIVVNALRSGPSTLVINLFDPTDVYDTFRLTYDPADGVTASPLDIAVETTQANYEVILRGLTPNTEYVITIVTLSGSGNNQTESDPFTFVQTTGKLEL